MRVDFEKKRDGVKVDHEKKSDGVRVHHDKKRWGESFIYNRMLICGELFVNS